MVVSKNSGFMGFSHDAWLALPRGLIWNVSKDITCLCNDSGHFVLPRVAVRPEYLPADARPVTGRTRAFFYACPKPCHQTKPVPVIAAFLFAATAIAGVVGVSLLFPNRLLERLWKLNPAGAVFFHSIGPVSGVFLLALGAAMLAAARGLLRGTQVGLVVRRRSLHHRSLQQPRQLFPDP